MYGYKIRSLICLVFPLILLISCWNPNGPDDPQIIPDWLLDRIALFESGNDSLQIESITRWNYSDTYVFYFKNFMSEEPDLFFDQEGIYIGGYFDSEWIDLSDSAYTDLSADITDDTLIWMNPLCENPDTTQDYEIINALLIHLYESNSFLHVLEKTDNRIDTESLEFSLAGGSGFNYHRMILRSLDQKNNLSVSLDSNRITLPIVHMFTNDEYDNVFCEGSYPNAWTNYYGIYPYSNGFVSLSLPALDPSGTMAIIKLSNYRNYSSAYGYTYILEKQDEHWVVTYYRLTWRT